MAQDADRLKSLIKLTCLVSSSLDPSIIRKRSILAATRLLEAETGSLLLLDEEAGELYFEVALGDKSGKLKKLRLKRGQGIAGWVAEHREPLIVHDAQNDERVFKDADKLSGFTTRNLVCVPVKAGKRSLGALQVINKLEGDFDEDDMEVLQAFSNQVAIAIENANLYERLRDTFLGTVEGLADIIEKRDPYTGGHTRRVREYSMLIGMAMGFDSIEMEILHLSAALHDIGKIGVPDQVLLKKGELSAEEREVMSSHPGTGAEMLDRIHHLRELVPNVRSHHERPDSTGYPDRIGGEEIPLISRIIAVADAFDAMTSNRPYRTALTFEEAFGELRRCSDTQFDSKVVEAFTSLWHEGEISS
jgi:HD-GYP domain-containing protein (c-di-GMP phosphodiesterase class II)